VTRTHGRIFGFTAIVLALGLVGCQTGNASGGSSENRESGTEPADSGTKIAQRDDGHNEEGDQPARAPGGGKAVFPEMEYDWGEVEQGEVVTHLFKVRNEGQEVLHIKNVRGS